MHGNEWGGAGSTTTGTCMTTCHCSSKVSHTCVPMFVYVLFSLRLIKVNYSCMSQQHIYVSIVSRFETLYFLQKEILFIANSKKSNEKASEWLQAHAYPAVSTLTWHIVG